MTDRDALLQAVLEHPSDDTPRLMYADALDDAGEAERAELIRAQCELARLPVPPDCTRPASFGWAPRLGHPSIEQMRAARRYWDLRYAESVILGAPVAIPPQGRPEWALPGDVRRAWPWDVGGWTWSRGFVSAIRAPSLAFWQGHAAALLAAHPLGRVEVADVPGLVWEVRRDGRGEWVLSGNFIDRDGYEWEEDGGVAFTPRPKMVANAADVLRAIILRLRVVVGDRWPQHRRYADRTPAEQAEFLRSLRAVPREQARLDAYARDQMSARDAAREAEWDQGGAT